jgi:hemolysin III
MLCEMEFLVLNFCNILRKKCSYTIGQQMFKGERINSISHLVGAVFSLVGAVLLIVYSSFTKDPYKIVGCTIYGVSLLIMYISSTLYHSLKNTNKKQLFQKFDHISIYILIAGTYTPFTLVTLRDKLGWTMFGIVWAIAVVGTIFKSIYGNKYDILSTLGYLLAGWVILIDIQSLKEIFHPSGFLWLIIGGAFYTVGAVFYLIEKLPRNHEIWHFFVLAASLSHFISVFFYII